MEENKVNMPQPPKELRNMPPPPPRPATQNNATATTVQNRGTVAQPQSVQPQTQQTQQQTKVVQNQNVQAQNAQTKNVRSQNLEETQIDKEIKRSKKSRGSGISMFFYWLGFIVALGAIAFSVYMLIK